MEPEGSLPHLQVPTTCPYPEPDQTSHWPTIPLPKDPSQYHPPIYAWVFQVVSFPNKTLYTPLLSPIRATCNSRTL